MMQMCANKFLNLRFKKQDTIKKEKKTNDDKNHPSSSEHQRNRDQRLDKAPGRERGKGKKVTHEDLTGKNIDADPSQESGRPG